MRKIVVKSGFTIVELLIVIVVVAILAAISIVAYTNISRRANASAAIQYAAQAAKKIDLYLAEYDTYPPDLSTAELSIPQLQYSYDNSVSPKTYCITATNAGVSYTISSAQPTPSEGACAGHPQGGIGTITPPSLASWSLSGGASYHSSGITVSSNALISPAFTLTTQAQKVRWIDGPNQEQAGIRLVLRFLREDGSTISAIQVRTASTPVSTAIVTIPQDTKQLQILTTGSSSGSTLSHGGYLYAYDT